MSQQCPSVELATVVIPEGTAATLEDGFRYVQTDGQITLLPGRIYRIGAVVGPQIPFTDTHPGSAGSGSGFSGAGVTILTNRFEVGGVLIEPVRDGTAALGRWAGGNATFLETDPPVAGGDFQITGIATNDQTNTLTITWNSTPGENYAIDFSQDLASWPGVFAPSVEASAQTQTSYTATMPALPNLFFRVRRNE